MVSFSEALSFPATTLVRFFHNHGFLQLFERPTWRTLSGRSREYIKKVIKPFEDKIEVNTEVTSVIRKWNHDVDDQLYAEVHTADGQAREIRSRNSGNSCRHHHAAVGRPNHGG